MPEYCGAIGERAKINLLWVMATGVEKCLSPMATRSHKGKAMSIE